ncbi:efflux RND transporter periplasmic adaptor subunit [Cypionkella sinensis]|uniref:Efflux RND transporter periplasmic adaptor subunit n=1 Tax=Cypionkella sinensis TaxID=1756043 RepID=A0ABV7J5U9_9RHOB
MARRRTGMAGWALLGLVALGTAGFMAWQRLAPVQEPLAATAARVAQPVRVTSVVFAAADLSVRYTGTIRPRHEVPLGFRLAGKLIARAVDVGDSVTKGQVLALLDEADAHLQLDAAEAELAAARTDLSRARADVARSRDLFAKGNVAQAALDRATSGVAEAQSRADRAQQMRDLAANQLSYMELVAEADGVVTATLAEPGQVVAAGQAVLSLAEGDGRDVVFALPEQSRALLDTAVARAELWGGGGDYALAFRDISPDVDPVGRTYRVRMTLAAPDAQAALGRTVTVRLTSPGTPAARLPLASVVNDGQGAAVWRLAQGGAQVERVPVELVTIEGQGALVRGGLATGDFVVSLGAAKIDPTRPVRVVETAASPES